MGYPFAAEKLSVASGKITDIYYRYEEMEGVLLSGTLENVAYQTDALVKPGNSGSPVFDMNGAVIGMAAAKNRSCKETEKSFVNSMDKLLLRKELLFQPSVTEGKILFYKETENCLQNTNLIISNTQIVTRMQKMIFITRVKINLSERLHIAMCLPAVFWEYLYISHAGRRLFHAAFCLSILKSFGRFCTGL